ncbi:alpha-1,4-glucan--maltose-1-phosphate maltosyltransferase [Streptomyces montanisoli]|uniref:Alpha-1,4-glucan:maltose-1-phosphate maltosyltransferase n=1 Tax=Streptomyces montanisoli TaxID=2798581 RepID=A0A940M554_9ACTN|nr:alpha-1,4-glucan--maltose-1-phosphate maltosyltransferase [Streptomyces montanisoli]MBP0456299.1 alpha-1,4-glucan--maltose-1-phosphate maltosyltransferase [Streptomyces montanisoli]
MIGRLGIDEVTPVVDGGRYPSKAVVGEHVPVAATIWREGHDELAAAVVLRGPGPGGDREVLPMERVDAGADRWAATAVPDRPGVWTYRVEAWSDPWATWRHGMRAKLDDGWTAEDLDNELEDGARLLERHAEQSSPGGADAGRAWLHRAAGALRDRRVPLADRVALALDGRTTTAADRRPLRELLTIGAELQVRVDRPRALAGAWYELFPRSTGGRDEHGKPVHGTFATAEAQLPRIARMGFDVLYLPPIHPIGVTHRKGPDNALTAAAGDVGSPWAIGSADGGHDAVHPELGTLDEFGHFVAAAAEHGLEVALDLAFQCSPDHPWVVSHPEWFTARPDGTVAFAENPPKRYQDIYPLDFDQEPAGLYEELLRVVLFWAERGVRIFRVDNPHTKPRDFWHWLIGTVKNSHPDVLFLAEAFTRPAVLKGLAKAGFTQSYTYFTWRTTKRELTAYLTELAGSVDYLRPNLFVNTPDILPAHLQQGSPAVFASRAALAALLSPTWGVYAGFELCENEALGDGGEEYAHAEKYELRPRDWAASAATGRDLQPWIATLNRLRRAHPAFGGLRTLRFHDIAHDALIAFSKTDPATGDAVLCVVSLAPDRPAAGRLELRGPLPGAGPDGTITARDALTGEGVTLGGGTITILPGGPVARVFTWSGNA